MLNLQYYNTLYVYFFTVKGPSREEKNDIAPLSCPKKSFSLFLMRYLYGMMVLFLKRSTDIFELNCSCERASDLVWSLGVEKNSLFSFPNTCPA